MRGNAAEKLPIGDEVAKGKGAHSKDRLKIVSDDDVAEASVRDGLIEAVQAANEGAELLDESDLEEITEGEAQAIEKPRIEAQMAAQAAKERKELLKARAELNRAEDTKKMDAFHDAQLERGWKESGEAEKARQQAPAQKSGLLSRFKRWLKG